MSHSPRSRASSLALLAAAALAASACQEEKKVPAVEADAGAPASEQAALGGKLAAAVKAAESARAPSSKAPGDGPPEKGYFAPGAADKLMAPGSPPKVEVLGDGAEPRVVLSSAPGDDDQKESMQLGVRLGPQQGQINVEYGLVLKVDKPKDKPKKDEKDEKKDASREPVRVLAKIVSVTPASQIPRELGDQIGKLKGSELRWQLSSERGATEISYSVAKGADPGLSALVTPLAEAVSLVTPALPSKPLGVGGYWMVTDRVTSTIVDVVRYRVFRVEKVEKDKATLSMDVRQYATKSEVDAGGGQKLTMEQFESLGKGRSEWTAKGLLPSLGDSQVRMALAGRIQSGQQGVVQTDFTVKLAAAEPDKADKKK
jgi:hypothetical protein